MKRLIVKNLIVQIPAKDSRTKHLDLSKLGWKRYSEHANFLAAAVK
jgi:hypothetical protein